MQRDIYKNSGTNLQLFSLTLLTQIIYGSFLLPASYLPKETKKHGLGEITTGFIMSLFAIGGIISSLLQAKYLSDIGKRTAIKYNSYILSLSMLIFTIAFTLSNKTSYVLANCVARLLQGVGVGGLSTVIYSYAPFIFNDRQQKVITYLEISNGIAVPVGIQIGKLINYFLPGPVYVFLIYGLTNLVTINLLNRLLPDIKQNNNNKRVSIKQFYSNFQFMIVFQQGILADCFTSFMIIGLSFEMIRLQNQTTNIIDYTNLITFYALIYLIFCFIIQIQCIAKLGYKVSIATGKIFCIISLVFLSRQQLFGIPQDIEYIIVGCAFAGIAEAHLYIYAPLELLVYGKQCAYEGTIEQVEDMISGLYQTSFLIGGFFGPIFLSIFYQYCDFQIACYVLQSYILIVLILYIIFCKVDANKIYQHDQNFLIETEIKLID